MNQQLQRSSSYHRAFILNCVRHYGPLSRTEIREHTAIRMATITELVKGLLEEGILCEGDSVAGRFKRGRKFAQLHLDCAFGYAVGVEFDCDHLCGVILDIQAHTVQQRRSEASFAPTQEEGICQLTDFIHRTLEAAAIPLEKVIGIGVADPSLIDSEKGISYLSTTIPGWQNVPIRQLLWNHFQVPIKLEENSRAKLLAEKTYGPAKNAGHLMLIDLGQGIGCSVMSPAGLYRGHTESAGELGHTCVVENGLLCRCGSYGCLETVASLPAIARQAVYAIEQGVQSLILNLADNRIAAIRADHVFAAARQGDKLALRLVEEAGKYIGVAIANAVNLFNPEVIIFDQGLVEAGDLLMEPIQRTITHQALPLSTKQLRFERSCLGNFAGAMGAATLILNDLFAIPQLPVPSFSVIH